MILSKQDERFLLAIYRHYLDHGEYANLSDLESQFDLEARNRSFNRLREEQLIKPPNNGQVRLTSSGRSAAENCLLKPEHQGFWKRLINTRSDELVIQLCLVILTAALSAVFVKWIS